jgi:peptidoglycan/LPS O-acetylase OafA/YrhL
VYPFYILHQTVIVVLAYYVVKTSDTILAKYLFILILTFLITMAIYHLFIRPYKIIRFLFGAKKEKQTEKISTPVSPSIALVPQPS